MKNLKDRLIRVEWTINIYLNKKGSHLVKEILLNVTLEDLLKVIIPNEDDPLLYDGYELTEKQLEYLSFFAEEKIIPSFKKYCYFLVCGGVYDPMLSQV